MVDFVSLGKAGDIFSRQRAARGDLTSCLLEGRSSAAVPALEGGTGELKYNSTAPGMHVWGFFLLFFFFNLLHQGPQSYFSPSREVPVEAVA